MINPNLMELLRVSREAAETLPVDRRIKVYRGLADICGDQAEERKLRTLADNLQKADDLCREFKFSFEQK